MTDTQMLIVALPSVLCLIIALIGIRIDHLRLNELDASITELRSHMDNCFDNMLKHLE